MYSIEENLRFIHLFTINAMAVRENVEQKNVGTCPEACSYTPIGQKSRIFLFPSNRANPVCGVAGRSVYPGHPGAIRRGRPAYLPAERATGVACARAYESSYPASFRSATDNNMYSRNAAAREPDFTPAITYELELPARSQH